MIRKTSALTALLLGLLTAQSAAAAIYTTQISRLLFFERDSLLYIYVQGGGLNGPTCATQNEYLVYSLSRPRAKEYVAGLSLAFASNRTVTFWTTGACTDQNGSDTLDYFRIEP